MRERSQGAKRRNHERQEKRERRFAPDHGKHGEEPIGRGPAGTGAGGALARGRPRRLTCHPCLPGFLRFRDFVVAPTRGAASRPTVAARARSAALRPRVGCTQPGAISAKGPMTNRRSWARGCGTMSPGASITARPQAMRSRSSVRGAFGATRVLPKLRSMEKSASRTAFGRMVFSTSATPLRYSGSPGSGQAAERHQPDRARTGNWAPGNRAKAASSSASDDGKSPAILEPKAMIVTSSSASSPAFRNFNL